MLENVDKKKIVTSLVTISAASALLIGATFAFFSSQATSNDNTFSTGNADLQIADDVLPPGDPDTYGSSIGGVSVSDMIPGGVVTKDFWLKNDSDGDFSMDLTADLDNLGGTTPGDLPDELLMRFTCDTDNNGIDGGDNTTAEKSIQAWIDDDPVALGTVGPNDGVSDATDASDDDELLCRMTARLPESSGNNVAGKDLSFDGIFEGTQVP